MLTWLLLFGLFIYLEKIRLPLDSISLKVRGSIIVSYIFCEYLVIECFGKKYCKGCNKFKMQKFFLQNAFVAFANGFPAFSRDCRDFKSVCLLALPKMMRHQYLFLYSLVFEANLSELRKTPFTC